MRGATLKLEIHQNKILVKPSRVNRMSHLPERFQTTNMLWNFSIDLTNVKKITNSDTIEIN